MRTCAHCGKTGPNVVMFDEYDEKGDKQAEVPLCVNRNGCWDRWSERYYGRPWRTRLRLAAIVGVAAR